MNENMQRALENVAAAKEALARTEQEARDLALAQLRAAQEACEAVGVRMKGRSGQKRSTPEFRARMAEVARQTWAKKTPEQRAAWSAAIVAGQRRKSFEQGVQ